MSTPAAEVVVAPPVVIDPEKDKDKDNSNDRNIANSAVDNNDNWYQTSRGEIWAYYAYVRESSMVWLREEAS